MSRDPRYDILFEPIKIGPVTAKNRFYQVPHCTGMGWIRPRMLAGMREVKAEGGWGVINTEYCSIHPSSDNLHYVSASLWDKEDIKYHRLMTDKVHAHDALAGVELFIGGSRTSNLYSREVPMDVTDLPNWDNDPYQCRVMDKQDIKNLKRWHRKAAERAVEAGFDIVYVYATHHYLLDNFLNPALNRRSDEYGGSMLNRMRLVRELIEETLEVVKDRAAVAVRFRVDEGGGADGVPVLGERLAMFEEMAELPDLWDINMSDYSMEMGVSRFVPEAALEPYVAEVKSKTSKPVVSVGRFTSPDTMVSQIKRGVLDMIGAARPSIADPFIPKKIEEGRQDDIRECIGCNICYTGDSRGVPIRCTQNPTMGEEWRKDWHPETMNEKGSDSSVLVVGGGPAGLEATLSLARRGYQVMLAEASTELGGRVNREAQLPGLSAWIRVRDYRVNQISKLSNVEIYPDNRLQLDDVLAIGAKHVAIATGSSWRSDGIGSYHDRPIAILTPQQLLTPDDIMSGNLPQGSCLVYDDDNFYMGSLIAEKLAANGNSVTYMTPQPTVSAWSKHNAEQPRVHRRLDELGIEIKLNLGLQACEGKQVTAACAYTGKTSSLECDNLVMVTGRHANNQLYYELLRAMEENADGAPQTLKKIGDADAPAIIAAATYAGHRYARELEEDIDIDEPMRHDRVFYED